MADLIELGLPSECSLLFMIDGAKALCKAITDTFGPRALIQCCCEYKKLNLIDALPETKQVSPFRTTKRRRNITS